MPELCNDLLACLDLRAIPPNAAAAGPAPDAAEQLGRGAARAAFEGRNQQLTYHRVFGGQLLGQFIRAASATCPGKVVRSLHVQFPQEGRSEAPLRYDVECHREGKAFATLAIVARQAHGVVATASVSMHASEDGPDHQTIAGAPAVPGEAHRVEFSLIPWGTRSTTALDSPRSQPPETEIWMRTPSVSPDLGLALTAYSTDLNLIGTALRPVEGVSQQDAGTAFTSAVTSHTLWFHRPFRTDDWLLLRQHSPILAHARCFGRGDVLTQDGDLVASYAQEALLRFRS